LKLPDGYIAAGYIRNRVWDHLHGFTERTPLNDVDVVYFNPHDLSEETDKRWPETATAAGIRYGPSKNIEIVAPHGLTDLFALVIRRSPYFADL
jgi:hypothetical protein